MTRLTDQHDRLCLAFVALAGALTLAIGFILLQLAVLSPSGSALRSAPAPAIHGAGAILPPAQEARR